MYRYITLGASALFMLLCTNAASARKPYPTGLNRCFSA